MVYIDRHFISGIHGYKGHTCNVWDTINIMFRREHREPALHHSSLSINVYNVI